jgi:MICOS complex subunit MIC12
MKSALFSTNHLIYLQVSGVALTTSVLYLSISIHRANRLRQSTLLSQQNTVLINIVDPNPPEPEPTARAVRAGLVDQAKDRWNTEIEGLARRVYDTDWSRVRANVEESVVGLFSRAVESGREKLNESGTVNVVPVAAGKREG